MGDTEHGCPYLSSFSMTGASAELQREAILISVERGGWYRLAVSGTPALVCHALEGFQVSNITVSGKGMDICHVGSRVKSFIRCVPGDHEFCQTKDSLLSVGEFLTGERWEA